MALSPSQSQPVSDDDLNEVLPSAPTTSEDYLRDASDISGAQLQIKRNFWRIENFLDYFVFVNDYQSYTTSSGVFYLRSSDNYRFYMKMTFHSKSIAVSLYCDKYASFDVIICSLSFRNTKNKILESCYNHRIDYESIKDRKQEAIANLKMDVNDQTKNLCHDNLLIVICEVKFFVREPEIKQIYVPKKCTSLKTDLEALLKSSNDCDVIFDVEDEQFKAHKVILKARSPVFKAMFEHDMNEKKMSRVTITNIFSEHFELMLQFIYTGEVEIESDVNIVMEILSAAIEYQLIGLQNLCEAKLFELIKPSEYEQIRPLAKSFNLTDFIKTADALMKSLTLLSSDPEKNN